MLTMPKECRAINATRTFCECIAGRDSADKAAQAFCERASVDPYVTGDDLIELKKALMDLED